MEFRVLQNRKIFPNEGFSKDPSDVIPVVLNFNPWLKAETISTFEVEAHNVTLDSSSESNGVVTAIISKGDNKINGYVEYKVTTSGAKVLERRINFKIEDL